MDKNRSEETSVALIAKDISYIKDEVKDIKRSMNSGFVSIDKYTSLEDRVKILQNAVIWTLGIIVAAIISAGLRVIIK